VNYLSKNNIIGNEEKLDGYVNQLAAYVMEQ